MCLYIILIRKIIPPFSLSRVIPRNINPSKNKTECVLKVGTMKKIILVLSLILLPCIAFADDIRDIEKFFDDYVAAANGYNTDYFSYYDDNAKIIRVVEKPDGTTTSVNIPLERYKKEAKLSVKLAKIRNYKNKYFNIKIKPHGKDYKISALRKPSTSDYKIPAHFIIGKDKNGEWKIKEESMNTKVQTFLSAG